jgi:glycosyl transferase family 25
MWDFIDKIIYINLDHRQDRRDIMSKFFEEGKIPLEKVVRFSAIKRVNGPLGCLQSHTEVLRIAKKNGWKNTLVLEDDLVWSDFDKGYEKLEELTKLPKWDVIMLAGWYNKYEFPRVFEAYNAGAYLINSHYIDTLLKNREYSVSKLANGIGFDFRNPKYFADAYWNELMQHDNWYCIYPCLCYQVDGFSDNGGRVIQSSRIIGIYNSKVKKEVYNQ